MSYGFVKLFFIPRRYFDASVIGDFPQTEGVILRFSAAASTCLGSSSIRVGFYSLTRACVKNRVPIGLAEHNCTVEALVRTALHL